MPALGPVLEQIGSLTNRIREYDRQIETISKEHHPETGLLRQVEGVGPLTALTFVLTLERIPTASRRAARWGHTWGSCPPPTDRETEDPQKRISKEGDEALRKLLVSGTHYILGPFGSDSDLRRHAEKIASRGCKYSKKRAVVATARKLAVLLHSLWARGLDTPFVGSITLRESVSVRGPRTYSRKCVEGQFPGFLGVWLALLDL